MQKKVCSGKSKQKVFLPKDMIKEENTIQKQKEKKNLGIKFIYPMLPLYAINRCQLALLVRKFWNHRFPCRSFQQAANCPSLCFYLDESLSSLRKLKGPQNISPRLGQPYTGGVLFADCICLFHFQVLQEALLMSSRRQDFLEFDKKATVKSYQW